MTTSRNKAECRICGEGQTLSPVHTFGMQPVAGYLEGTIEEARRAPRFENAIGMCMRCCLVQQANDDASSILAERVYATYQRTYSMSKKVSSYLDEFLSQALSVAAVAPGDSVVEIGSNDGSLLHLVADRDFRAFGFDPSGSDEQTATVQVIRDFFTEETASAFAATNGSVKLVVSRHTLEHAFQPLDFFRGVREVLASDGRAVVEVPYVVHQIMNNQFQSFTFQHVSFFSVHSMLAAAGRAGLAIDNIKFVEMDGGSIVVVLRRVDHESKTAAAVQSLLDFERTLGYATPEVYVDYFNAFGREKAKIHSVIDEMNRRGISVVGYGAGSKGQAMVNMLELGPERIAAVVDDTHGVAGKFIPGSCLAVVAADEAVLTDACVFVTAPTHAKEIVAKQRQARDGGVYLCTIPRFCWL